MARFTPAGALDATFGEGGVLALPLGPISHDFAIGVTVDSQDRILIAGYTSNINVDIVVIRLTAGNGSLDSTFDGDGKQTVDFSGSLDFGYAVSVDALGRIVVAGQTNVGGNYDFAVVRLTESGALDTSFDGDGKQTISFGSGSDGESAVAIDSLGRIVLAGAMNIGTNSDVAVARLAENGALDNSFDGDGKVVFAFGSSVDDAGGLTVDSLDRVVVAGSSVLGSNYDFTVARLTDTGALDSSFDFDGKQIISFSSLSDRATGVAVDSLGRIAVVGNVELVGGLIADMAVARLTSTGLLDLSFDGDGKQTIHFGDFDDAYGMAIDFENRVVGAGYSRTMVKDDMAVFRLTATGELDASFDADGRQTLALNAQSLAFGRAVAMDGLGRTLVAGYTGSGTNIDFTVTRYTAGGRLDLSFGGSGVVSFSFSPTEDYAFAVAVDSLNRVIVAGRTNSGTDIDFAVARLTPAGVLDTSFDGDGKQTIEFGTRSIAYSVAIDSSDRIVVAGQGVGFGNDFAVARLLVNGALDPSFNADGKTTIEFGVADASANAVAIDSLGRIMLVGYFGQSFALARLTDSGFPDTSFAGVGQLVLPFTITGGRANAVAFDSLDRIVVAGYAFTTSNFDFAVARFTTAGALDNTFDGDGKLTIAFGSSQDVAYGVAVDSLDRILVAGETGDTSLTDFAVARLTEGGALDSNFDGDGKQTIDFGAAGDTAFGIAMNSADQIVLAGSSELNGKVFSLARLTGDTTVAAAQINDGSVQRSKVTSLTIRFSGEVTFNGTPAQAFTLMRNGGKAVSFTTNVSVEFGGTVVTLSNFTGAETQFGSLRDGRYTLTAFASLITADGQPLDGDANGTPGDDYTFGDAQGLFRMYGDFNGDRQVDGVDFSAFSSTYGLTSQQAGFLAVFDVNGDGQIDGVDFSQFSGRVFTVLP